MRQYAQPEIIARTARSPRALGSSGRLQRAGTQAALHRDAYRKEFPHARCFTFRQSVPQIPFRCGAGSCWPLVAGARG
ncbi:hypothetical protein KPSA3_02951 [Pseudomonas syringae pv. actinidiae]|uniref:Uncharacterized protein n=1 Tax=Pseudomonas syringae pv. actinidiae TaxID=103796 RepID=A0AAN4Q463_PSESF|nr:hypothetical protein KPSA3_02951 [Pseudomonas syringae pv. actinidiae]